MSLLLAALAAAVLAQGQQLPQLTAPVNDFAQVVDQASSAELDRRIRALQQATGDAIVVVTVETFAPYATIDEFAVELFENRGAGIGRKGQDNGALIVLAVEDRQVRVEVGYGLEEFITDGFAGETRDAMVPFFRNGQYGPGLLVGATRLINRVADRRGVKLDVPRQDTEEPASEPLPIGRIVMLGLIALLIISSLRRRRPSRRYWGRGPWSGWNSGVGPFGGSSWGGGFGGFGGGRRGGGGFGGFGGGRSGGGGASGGW